MTRPSTVIDIGLDLGTTASKAVALDGAGCVVGSASLPTQWRAPHPEWAEREADAVDTLVGRLLGEVLVAAERSVAVTAVRSIGVTGMAESGTVLDRDGVARAPMIAWYDPRGRDEITSLPDDFGALFPGRTGLPMTPLATLFKLRWLQQHGLDLAGLQWLSLPEYVCHRLGGRRAAERSMLGRTGLLDIHTGELLPEALHVLRADPALVPSQVPAGTSVGTLGTGAFGLDDRYAGAVLTVAGHDHLVAAAAADAAHAGTVFDSMGTAEAFVCATPTLPSPESVAALVALGVGTYSHVVSNTTALIAGMRTGLVLKRVLAIAGLDNDEGRRSVDTVRLVGREAVGPEGIGPEGASPEGASPAAGIRVHGYEMAGAPVSIVIDDDEVTPQDLWAAALHSVTTGARGLVDGIRSQGVEITDLVVAGGWTRMASVLATRGALAATVRQAHDPQPGLIGAALMGRWASGVDSAAGIPPHDSPPANWFAQWSPDPHQQEKP